ncbi:MAG: hypothetical protein FWG11_08985 [Promicromonosporaceae bacterium]|nr:hypothetical protein [Promicromonosporaceae bacterium]
MSVALAATALLTGCDGGETNNDAESTWQEPAWVAQFRQDMEEFQLANIACFAELGIEVVKDPAGGGLPVMPNEGRGEVPAAWLDILEVAGLECLERTRDFAWFHLPVDEEAHQRMLDARNCLLAHGHHVSEPPSFEVWREDVLAWTPHGDVFHGLQRQGIGTSASDWAAMNADCPQPAQHMFSITGLQ